MRDISRTKNIKDSGQFQILDTLIVDSDPKLYPCADRICEQCGNDHDFNRSFDDVKTSIDIIPELLAPRGERNTHTNLVGNKKKSDLKPGVHVRAISKTRCNM